MSDRSDRLREAHAVAAVRSSARRRMDRVTGAWLEILQTGVAAAVAWQAAKLIVGQSQPFFAPIAAVLALGLSRGQPRRRAVELGLGVALGILIADLLVQLIGTGTWQIGVVVVLAMSAALVVGAGILLVNQAAISAILVITLPSLSQGGTLDRLFDALIGAAVALVLSQVLFPRDPVRQMGKAAGRVLDELALALEETAVALADADQTAAEHALERVRALDDAIGAFYDAVAVGRENAWLSPARRRRSLGHLRSYADAARQVDYAVRNTRILARNAAQAARTGPPDQELADAVSILADAVRALGRELATPDQEDEETRYLARQAADQATSVLGRRSDLRTNMVVGQVRATATDLLRGTGLDTQAARLTPPGTSP
ncbi:MAG TPA: FUSC family protein [Thermoleophilaceae bacterium]|nr:FUSC family protein [Thermoleophilaceae bacterium]